MQRCQNEEADPVKKFLLRNWTANFEFYRSGSWLGIGKESAGIDALAVALVLACMLCVWCMCRLRNAQVHTAAMVVQAFATVEAGQSPQI